MQWFLDQLAKEWSVIKLAPLSAAIVLLLSLGLSYAVCRWIYNERLSARDDLVKLYQQKMGMGIYVATAYGAKTNKELAAEGMRVAASIRQLAVTGEDQMQVLMREFERQRVSISEPGGIIPPEKFRAASRSLSEKMSSKATTNVREYDQNYKSDAILIRDEVFRRLPQDGRTSARNAGHPFGHDAFMFYGDPTNLLGIKAVAENLDALCRALLR